MNFIPGLVSVIIPTFNQAYFLPQAIESILKQSYKMYEIIVVDDGSTDETQEVLKHFRKIKYIYQENKGPAAARNTGIKIASGEYISMLDADDLYHFKKIESQVRALKTNPHCSVAYSAFEYIDEKGRSLGFSWGEQIEPVDFFVKMLFRNIVAAPASIMVKRECFYEVGLYNESFIHSEDYDLLLRLARNYSFIYIDSALYKYRRHSKNLSYSVNCHQKNEKDIVGRFSLQEIRCFIDKTTFSGETKELFWARILYKLGYTRQSLYTFKKILKLNPDNSTAAFYVGNYYVQAEDFIKAIKFYRQCLATSNLNPVYLNNLGVALAKCGDCNQARTNFEKALKLMPDYYDAKYNLKLLKKGQELIDDMQITWRELRGDLVPYKNIRKGT